MRVTKVACPRCRAALKTSRPLTVGKTVKCPQCGEPFTVSADEAPRGAGAPTPPAPGAVSLWRLAYVLAGVAVFVTAGAGLAAYCFSVSHPQAPTTAEPGGNGTAAAPPAPAEPPLITLSPEEQVPIDQAIIAGVRYLKTTQAANGTWDGDHPLGYAALPGLVLLDCDLPPDDPTVRKAADFVRKNAPANVNTYELALAILFLDRLAVSTDRPLIQSLALRLVAGQTHGGTWTYDCPVLKPEEEHQLLTLLNSLGGESFADWSEGHPEEAAKLAPAWKGKLAALQDVPALKDAHFKKYSGDNSTTQFAVLGLWTARRYDLPLDRTMALMVRHFRSTQNADGSWNYSHGNPIAFPPWPSMTAAGLLGLATGQGLAKDDKAAGGNAAEDTAVDKGLKVLGQHIGKTAKEPPGRPKVPQANLYFVWSVERVAVIYNLKTIDDKDWYAWGSQMLLDNQDPEKGCWRNGGVSANATIDTCFALLFLKQANLLKDLTSKLQLVGGAKKP